MITHENPALRAEFDPDSGLATLTLARAGGVNPVDEVFTSGLADALTWATQQAALRGVILTSAHKNFCVGADIDTLYPMRDPATTLAYVQAVSGLFRRVETLGVPVVAVLNGSALGGGYELALACHHRIALADPRLLIGLPEVSLGVLPGAGGTQRLPRLIGLQRALEHITQGRPVRADRALKLGMIDALAPDLATAHELAKPWISAHPQAKQAWDEKNFVFPGPHPASPEGRNILLVASAMLYQKVAHTMPHIEAAVAAIQEGGLLTFDRALEVEARAFARSATSDTAKDMIRTFWYHKNAAEKHEDLPNFPRDRDPQLGRAAVLGAGMMGAGIALALAEAAYSVVVFDQLGLALERAKSFIIQALEDKRHLAAEARAEVLARLSYTTEVTALAGSELVIEAISEDEAAKHALTRRVAPSLAPHALWASNTSAIPITRLATAFSEPAHFIGLHFFSPVAAMPLIEVIRGEATSDESVARALTVVRRLKKLPIVVGDGYGFYTSRVFGAYLLEAVSLLAEGHPPALIEQAARHAGMAVPPLKVFDEVTLSLGLHALLARATYRGEDLAGLPGVRLLRTLVNEHHRLGKASGAGFYDYPAPPGERALWPGLGALVATLGPRGDAGDSAGATPPASREAMVNLADRLLLAQAVEAVRCLDEGVVLRPRDAELGAIFGVGFAPATGGPLAWLDRQGAAAVIAKLEGLAAQGPAFAARFAVPARLRQQAAATGDDARFWPNA